MIATRAIPRNGFGTTILIAHNRDAQVWGWFAAEDERHWPRALKQPGAANPQRPQNDTAADYQAQRRDGAPTDLSLEKLSLSFEGNLYAVLPGQGLFGWGARHKEYATLDLVRADLNLESGRVVESLGDGPATDPVIVAQLDRAGETIEEWDPYRQPTGIHYSPHALFRTHQDKAWLDFQWCQTGHNGEHVPERVADMWRNTPVKAVANGEPTYENIGKTGRGAGWWQGHEAWRNLTAGGTMGLVYGAGSLWQWRLHANEPDHADWCTAPGAGWREALDIEGSRYPGIAAKIFDRLPFAEMQPNWTYTYGRRGLAVPGKLIVLYLPEGGGTGILTLEVPRAYRIYDPRTGQEVGKDRLPNQAPVQFNNGEEERWLRQSLIAILLVTGCATWANLGKRSLNGGFGFGRFQGCSE